MAHGNLRFEEYRQTAMLASEGQAMLSFLLKTGENIPTQRRQVFTDRVAVPRSADC